jgi:LDH2 family malate/lactate/ureidoglycolate dehydrogenase
MAFPFDLQSRLQVADNPLVLCGCGRSVNLDMMRDVRAVKQVIGSKCAGRHPCEVAVATSNFVCDSCMEYHHNMGHISRADYYAMNGAPANVIAIQTARDTALAEMRGQKSSVTQTPAIVSLPDATTEPSPITT